MPGGIYKMPKPGGSLTPVEMSLIRYIIHSSQGTGLNLWASKMLFENMTKKSHLKRARLCTGNVADLARAICTA